MTVLQSASVLLNSLSKLVKSTSGVSGAGLALVVYHYFRRIFSFKFIIFAFYNIFWLARIVLEQFLKFCLTSIELKIICEMKQMFNKKNFVFAPFSLNCANYRKTVGALWQLLVGDLLWKFLESIRDL